LTAAIALGVFGLAYDRGTYALTSRNAIAIAIWWLLILAVALSLLPHARPSRAALATGGLLTAFAVLTGLSLIWAESAEKAFAELDRVLLYLGVFTLAVTTQSQTNARRWRDGIALGLVAVALLALASRLFGDMIGDSDLATLLPDVSERLSYPVDYWNGLAILVALAFPLVIASGIAQRRALASGLILAPLPALVAVIYLTSSRGGAATAAVGTLLFVALTGRRLAALAATISAAIGSALVIVILQARPELIDGPLDSAAASSQGKSAAALIALACIATGLIYTVGCMLSGGRRFQLGLGLRRLLALGGVVAVVAAVVAADPAERFDRFKQAPRAPTGGQQGFTRSHLLSGGGSGRWQFWSGAVDEYKTRPALGRGAGSYEAWWAEHGSLASFVRDAHSLYVETLGELGLVGLALLVSSFVCGLLAAARRLRKRSDEARSLTAAFAATFVAFAFGAAIDWVWELTVVGVVGILCLGLLCGPTTATRNPARAHRSQRLRRLAPRALFVAAGVAVVIAQGIPLLAQNDLKASQEAAARGDARVALKDALAARGLQSWAASPHLQLALVEEQTGDLRSARAAIAEAIERDRSDWRLWLVSARLEAKSGRANSARRSLREARRLNPRSPLLAQ
jgi:tetratricopeptide (TPR) repeat protein